jgi:GNAT superfamily N-acetyltransferase
MPTVRIKEVDGQRQALTLSQLQRETFIVAEHIPTNKGFWWLAIDGCLPVGFVCIEHIDEWQYTGYLSRVGVLPSHRGHGLQKRLMQACERKARQLGWARIISSTYNNPNSANNFIRCGYRCYQPEWCWGADGTVYWIKDLA